MPFIPLIVGGLALTGGLFAFNAVDDNLIDPVTGATDKPVISNTGVAMILGGVALLLLAKRHRLL